MCRRQPRFQVGSEWDSKTVPVSVAELNTATFQQFGAADRNRTCVKFPRPWGVEPHLGLELENYPALNLSWYLAIRLRPHKTFCISFSEITESTISVLNLAPIHFRRTLPYALRRVE